MKFTNTGHQFPLSAIRTVSKRPFYGLGRVLGAVWVGGGGIRNQNWIQIARKIGKKEGRKGKGYEGEGKGKEIKLLLG